MQRGGIGEDVLGDGPDIFVGRGGSDGQFEMQGAFGEEGVEMGATIHVIAIDGEVRGAVERLLGGVDQCLVEIEDE